MEVAKIQPQKPPLQMLFRVTFASVCFLLIISLWAIIQYCEEEGDIMAQMHSNMQPTYQAFDANRAAQPISDIRMQLPKSTCKTGWTKLELFRWTGANAGYMTTAEKFFTGPIPATVSGASTISEHSWTRNFVWDGAVYCAKTMRMNDLVLRDSSTSPCAGGDKSVPCSECYCSKKQTAAVTVSALDKANTLCPFASYKVTGTKSTNGDVACTATAADSELTVGGDTLYQYCTWGDRDNTSWMVGLQVELFNGGPCMNPNEHPKSTTANDWTTVLKQPYTGCGSLGTNPYAVEIGSATANEFRQANDHTMGQNQIGEPLTTALTGATTTSAKLYSVHRIEMKCSSMCQNMKIEPIMTAMLAEMTDTYADIQVLIYITAIGGGLCMLFCLMLIMKRSEASQDEYFQFWGATLLVLLVTMILMGLLVHSMSTNYNAQRNQLPVVKNCITNSNWQQLPQQLFNLSSMESEHNWAITWLVFGILLILGMGWVMMQTSQQLAMGQNGPGQYAGMAMADPNSQW